MLDEGLISRRWSIDEIAQSAGRLPTNFPSRRAHSQLVALRAESPVADSILEAKLLRVVCGIGGFGPVAVHHQVVVHGSLYVLDATWPHLRVAVEVVGRAHRVASRSCFDRERRKFNALAADGWQVAHLTAAMSDREVGRDVTRLLARASSRVVGAARVV